MTRVLEAAAVIGFDWDGRGLSRHLDEKDRADLFRQLRGALEHLAGNPDALTVKGMAKTPDQEKRVREAWRKLVMGLVDTDKEHDRPPP